MLGHAWRCKALQGSDLAFEDLFKSESVEALKRRTERLAEPVFYRQKVGSKELDMSGPLQRDNVYSRNRRIIATVGLKGESHPGGRR